MDLSKFHTPNVKKSNKELYPKEHKTKGPGKFLVWRESKEQIEKFKSIKNYSEYEKEFLKNPREFDLHGHHFQDLCLQLTNDLSIEEVKKMSHTDHPSKRILRGRVYAISTRENIGWDGKLLTDEEKIKEKKKIIEEHLNSLILYDWTLPNIDLSFLKQKPRFESTKVGVKNIDTQSATVEMVELHPDAKVCWLNLAASHNVCGSYSVDFGGSQEEEVATNCSGCSILGTCGKFVDSGFKSYVRGTWVKYQDGYHIPPGGNYFCKTKFITGNSQVDCYMIVTAFADFRPYIPFFVPYSESGDYYTLLGSISDEKKLEERLILDMHSTLMTAMKEGIDVLVLGASGCGAFLHDPVLESKLWKDELKLYDGQFKEVIFAVLDSKDGKNITAFSERFN